ncbi:MAG: hypothetical protein LBF22_03965 [Deltaproteobacteria bacterium]|jgi:hypothetical protein|nr:hypothetical protein [Deltaproteobacteria bacterium]
MSTLIKSAFTSLILILFSATISWAGPNVLDIQELKGLGLKDATIEDIVTVSLKPRARKPLDADFIKELASYGGDPLTSAYLNLDSLSSSDPECPIGRDKILKLIAARVKSDEIIEIIHEALRDYKEPKDVAPSAGSGESSTYLPAMAMAGAGIAGTQALNSSKTNSAALENTSPQVEWSPDDFSSVESQNIPQARILETEQLNSISDNLANPENLDSLDKPSLNIEESTQIEAEKLDPILEKASQIEPEKLETTPDEINQNSPLQSAMLSDGQLPLSMEDAGSHLATDVPVLDPKETQAQNQEDLRNTPQTLYRGQKADPARPMPRGGTLYPVREPQEDDAYFMGSYRYETLDSHAVDVHRASKSGVLGTRVESRANGQKVHRYFSGRPERKVQETETSSRRSSLGGTPNEIVDYFE